MCIFEYLYYLAIIVLNMSISRKFEYEHHSFIDYVVFYIQTMC